LSDGILKRMRPLIGGSGLVGTAFFERYADVRVNALAMDTFAGPELIEDVLATIVAFDAADETATDRCSPS
jgi:hypothetical protein